MESCVKMGLKAKKTYDEGYEIIILGGRIR